MSTRKPTLHGSRNRRGHRLWVALIWPGQELQPAQGDGTSQCASSQHCTDKRYVRLDENGRFKESDDVRRSLAADKRQKAKAEAKKGQGDRGERK
jgi:hypothetical protein